MAKDYSEKKKLIEMEMKLNEQAHKNKMAQLEAQRELDRERHDNECARIRIKSAEIRRSKFGA